MKTQSQTNRTGSVDKVIIFEIFARIVRKSIKSRIHELEPIVLNVVQLFVKLIQFLYANTVFKLYLQSIVKDLRHIWLISRGGHFRNRLRFCTRFITEFVTDGSTETNPIVDCVVNLVKNLSLLQKCPPLLTTVDFCYLSNAD